MHQSCCTAESAVCIGKLRLLHLASPANLIPTDFLLIAMKKRPPDPVLQSSWREAIVVFAIWLTALIWSVGFCARYGYGRTEASLTYVLGFPDWIFWGVALPWVICVLVSLIVSRFVMRDEDLGIDPDEAMREIIEGNDDV